MSSLEGSSAAARRIALPALRLDKTTVSAWPVAWGNADGAAASPSTSSASRIAVQPADERGKANVAGAGVVHPSIHLTWWRLRQWRRHLNDPEVKRTARGRNAITHDPTSTWSDASCGSAPGWRVDERDRWGFFETDQQARRRKEAFVTSPTCGERQLARPVFDCRGSRRRKRGTP